jgi:hypothetical protein
MLVGGAVTLQRLLLISRSLPSNVYACQNMTINEFVAADEMQNY